MSNPHQPERQFLTPTMLALWVLVTLGLVVASVPFSGDVEAVLIAAAAFFGLGAVLILSSLVANGVVGRVAGWLSR